MKRTYKISIGDISVLLTCNIILGVLFGFILYFLAVYVIVPTVCGLVPSFAQWLDLLTAQYDDEAVYKTIHAICALLGIFPTSIVTNCYLLTDRKKRFIHDTDGLVTAKEALVYHKCNFLITDIFSIVITTVCFMLIELFVNIEIVAFSFNVLYDNLSLPFAFVTSFVTVALAQFIGVIRSRNYWCADNCIGG